MLALNARAAMHVLPLAPPLASQLGALPPTSRLGAVRRAECVLQLQGEDDRFDDLFFGDLEAELRRVSAGGGGSGVLRKSRQARRSQEADPFGRDRSRVGISRFFSQLARDYDEWVSNPGQELLLGTVALLLGNYIGHFLDTSLGQAGWWETAIGAVATFVCEQISREYYITQHRDRTATLRHLQALKVGFLFALIIDALKLAG